ncbi:hypothetical protein Y1Q_0023962 [Alligator mississippiensis]|uniref:Uncharacterized protein n=1 Tax=Alligator mississippiensis TaxID=8496 RepID=A0A151MLX3_ALLMI|nr:hypothetical protein Y1Q_0023962 [Alligator mississippiensis]
MEGPASLGQELSQSCSSPSLSCCSSSVDLNSSLESRSPPTPGTSITVISSLAGEETKGMEEEEEDQGKDWKSLEEAAVIIRKHLQEPGEELMEDVSMEEDLGNILPDSIAAILYLSNCVMPAGEQQDTWSRRGFYYVISHPRLNRLVACVQKKP